MHKTVEGEEQGVFYHLLSSYDQERYSAQTFFMGDDLVSQCHKFGSAFLWYFSWESTLPCCFNFPISHAPPEKLCDFYWVQLRITCKSGWIAQAEKRYCISKGGKSKLTAKRRTKSRLTYCTQSPEATKTWPGVTENIVQVTQ